MILYEESKALEHALGEDAAKIITKVFERQGALVTMELPTKKDLADGLKASRSDFQAALRESELRTQLEIEKVRAETEKVRAEVKETESRLKIEIEKVRAEVKETEARLTEKLESNKHEILKWITSMIVAQAAVFIALAGVAVGLVAFYPK